MTTSRKLPIAFAAALALALGGCSSSDDGASASGGRDDDIRRLGFLLLAYPPEGPGGSSPIAFFQRFTDPVPLERAIGGTGATGDTCTVERDGDGEEIPAEPLDATSIAAGDALTLSTVDGLYYTMSRRDDGVGGHFYRGEGFLSSPLPDALTLDVPGDDFPGFAAVPLPVIEPLRGASADGRSVTPATRFVWEAGGAETAIDLQVSGERDGVELTLLCDLADDGEFTLSETTRAELGEGFTGIASLTRRRTSIVRDGDAALLVQLERSAETVDVDETGDEGPIGEPGTDGDAGFLGTQVPSSSRAARLGTIGIVGEGRFDEAEAFASFYGLARDLPVDLLLSTAPDACTIVRGDAGEDAGFRDENGIPVDAELLDAGDTITFTAPGGTWLTLPARRQSGFIDYSSALSDVTLPLPIPDALVLDVPGLDFPAFRDMPVADAAPPTKFSPANGSRVTGDTSFTWSPAPTEPATFIGIVLRGNDAEGALTGVSCLVRDDGEFALPAVTRAELGTGFSGLLEASRVAPTARLQGDALLVVFRSSPAD